MVRASLHTRDKKVHNGVATLVFSQIHLVPGEPAPAMLSEAASPQGVAEPRQRLGLDRPLLEQYSAFLEGAVKGDLNFQGDGLRDALDPATSART